GGPRSQGWGDAACVRAGHAPCMPPALVHSPDITAKLAASSNERGTSCLPVLSGTAATSPLFQVRPPSSDLNRPSYASPVSSMVGSLALKGKGTSTVRESCAPASRCSGLMEDTASDGSF